MPRKTPNNSPPPQQNVRRQTLLRIINSQFGSAARRPFESVIQSQLPPISVLLITAYGSIDLTLEALKRGASDFVVKPWNNQKLLKSLLRTSEIKRSRREQPPAEKKANETKALEEEHLDSRSPRMQQVMSMAEKVTATDVNVLITAENGTGKEVMATYIHHHSR